jgi:hypothetical protein
MSSREKAPVVKHRREKAPAGRAPAPVAELEIKVEASNDGRVYVNDILMGRGDATRFNSKRVVAELIEAFIKRAGGLEV